MTHPPCLRLCPAYPGNPRYRIEGESPPQGMGHTVYLRQFRGSSRRALDRRRAGLLGEHLVLGPWRDLRPALGLLDRLAHAIEELPLGGVVLPASAVVEFDEMIAPALGQAAPLLRDRIECMGGVPCRH